MRITTKGRYALRAMCNLALADNSRPKAIKTIAAEENISPEFLEQIFFKLKKAGVIDSVRGPGGGFILSRTPESVSVRTIFEAVDEGLNLTPCTTCDENGDPMCSRVDVCLVHDVWREASEHINSFFDKVTLKRIMEKGKAQEVAELLEGKNVAVV